METSRALSTIVENLEKKTQKTSCQPNRFGVMVGYGNSG